MNEKNTKILPYFFAGAGLAVLGWGGIAALWLLTEPYLGQRWLFFLAVFLAVAGTAMPFVALLHERFPSEPPVDASVHIRQSLWFGLFACLILWLQWSRMVTLLLVILIGGALAGIEFLIRLREKSLWKPKEPESE
jgi:hypothetical protein